MRTLRLTAFPLMENSHELLRSLVSKIAAGSPLEVVGDEECVDLNHVVSGNSTHTMIITVEGDSMCPEIGDGDRVVVALGKPAEPGNIVVARIDGGYTIKRFRQSEFRLFLVPANKD